MENRRQGTERRRSAGRAAHLGTSAPALILALLSLAAIRPAGADTQNLEQFLRDAEQAAQATVPLRGDGQFEVTSPEGTRRDQVAAVIRPTGETFIELREERIKVLLLRGSGQAFQFKGGAAGAESFSSAASFAESDFTREDFEPFRLSGYTEPRISDDSATELTVMLVPKASQYSLLVITFDRQKKVPLKTLYYRDTLSNLVKMRRDSDHVLVGGRWMPTAVTMETFTLRTRTTFTVHWSEGGSAPPALFDPAAFARPSSSLWSAAAPAP